MVAPGKVKISTAIRVASGTINHILCREPGTKDGARDCETEGLGDWGTEEPAVQSRGEKLEWRCTRVVPAEIWWEGKGGLAAWATTMDDE